MKLAALGSREIPIQSLGRSLRSHPVRIFLALGVVTRVAQYLADRSYWMDEGSIVGCIEHLAESGLFGPLAATQLAPPGFLAGEWGVISLLGTSRFAFRLIPLLAGIAALFLFRDLARRCLSPRGECLAVALCAVADDLIYFASEVKQYSSDLAVSLALLVVACRSEDARGPRTGRQALGLAALGAGMVWCSHPAIFTLAGIGLVGLIQAARARDWRRALVWVGVGLTWVASFAGVHAVAMRQLGYRRDMWFFWDFAFPPLPPRSLWDLLWPVRRLAFLFASPLNFDLPFGARWSIWPAVALLVVGSVRLARTRPGLTARLALPGMFALGAAYARLYPFHGRLLLFWVPVLLIPVAAGLDEVRARWLRWFLVAWVVGFPTLQAAYRFVEPRQRSDPNPYGDRRPSNLNPYWFPLPEPPYRPPSSGS